jgi:hypothetical protein
MNPAHPSGIIFDPLFPVPLVALLGLLFAGLTLWVYSRAGARLSPLRRWTLAALRLAALALVLLIFLQPSRIEPLTAQRKDKVTLVAIDSSRSMRQKDSGKLSRLDAARQLLWNSGIARASSDPAQATTPSSASTPNIRFFQFGSDATPVTASLDKLSADDRSTRFHKSIQSMLDSLGTTEGAHALFLLTDGHDFELANPSQTALLARNRQIPIYAVPFGGEGNVRDVSVRVTAYQPFHYAKQTIQLNASIRILGAPYETLKASLLREGQVVQSRNIVVRDEAQLPLQFTVSEPLPGQFEYQIRIEPLGGESDTANNSAAIYCNVVDKRIRLLVLEAEPYWDTTFLLRSLRRNEKFDVDSAIRYGKDRLSVIRNAESKEPFRLPASAADWNDYDVVFLGHQVDSILPAEQVANLEKWVDQAGGALVFARGQAFAGTTAQSLQPVQWGRLVPRPGPVRLGREGRGITPFRTLEQGLDSPDALPTPLGLYEASERKPLTATLAVAETGTEFPAMVHRRVGAGQVLSIGVDGLWRWAFNDRSDGRTSVYDRFWDQTVLWLMSGRDLLPSSAFTFRADTGNVPLGEKIRFRILSRDPEAVPTSVPIVLRHEGREVARLTCTRVPGTQRLTGEFLPESTGRYEAVAELPDASHPAVRFAAFADDAEETEVAADATYLRRLCEASRGRVLKPDEFAATLAAAQSAVPDESPRTRKTTLWDRAWLFWLAGGLFGADWFLRRRWGLC